MGRPSWASASRVSPRARSRCPTISHPAIAVNLDACIQCTRCLRACRDEQVNDVIGLAFRGDHAKIVFDMDDAMGASTCVACGECVQACPTGALMPAPSDAALRCPTSQVDSVCPYCGVGCQLTYHVKDDKILRTSKGRDGPANHNRLCVKGRYGFDYAHHPQRLTVPLIRRKPTRPRHGRLHDDPDPGDGHLSAKPAGKKHWTSPAASWRAIRDTHGKKALAGFGSAKGSNEEAYLFQKLVRTGLRQQQRRPLHAPVPCLVGGGAARRHRLGCGQQPGDGRDQGRGGDRDRRQPDREPPGGRKLDQERGAKQRHQADRDGPAPQRPLARAPLHCSSSPTPTSRC